MDKADPIVRLREGAQRLGIDLRAGVEGPLFRLRDELLRWNAKVNLTAITDPDEVVEKHLLDSLAVAPEVEGARTLTDIGTGAGFPGLVLKLQLPELQLTLVETVGKKVNFLKHAALTLGLQQVRAHQVRAAGHPDREGIPPSEVVISRAFTDVEAWVPLAKKYLLPGGRVVAMLGQVASDDTLRAVAERERCSRWTVRRYALPFSGAARAVASFWS